MQQRRYRPGDVLDDYCPRERRITDHAIVAMIEDDIKQTRCVVCDAEHEYKDGKVPSQRRKKPRPALFTQVLEGLQGPQPAARLAPHFEPDSDSDVEPAQEPLAVAPRPMPSAAVNEAPEVAVFADAPPAAALVSDDDSGPRDERPWRRQLIRAALPRPEGQQPQPTRQLPDFTVRQPNTRNARHGRRRGAGQGPYAGGMQGPMRSGRDAHAQPGQRPQGGRRRRRGKKPS
jgi:hypothetical protein